MTVSLYPAVVLEQDLSPNHGGSKIDDLCQEIHDATKGWGANKQKVIDAIATQDATTRYYLAIRYGELFADDTRKDDGIRTLQKLMRKEFSGDFATALEFLSLPAHMAECAMIRRACKGIGAAVNVVWSIVCGRTNAEMELLKRTYFQMYDTDLGKVLASELHGDMERLVFNCLQAAEMPYDAQYHTADLADEHAQQIHSKGQGKVWGTDEKGIFKILCASPPEHLQAVNAAYADKYGYTLLKALEKELGGLLEAQLRKATLYLIGMKLKPYETMAALIKEACAGLGTDELLLTCSIIRFQTVMTPVMGQHIEQYGKTIHERVRSEVGGKYKTLLLQVLNTVWPEEG
uniref:Annexin n=1 Tax=Amphora coffeiformis TaxID=265554 RepID=A0A7S3P5T1_9STRA|mmetsp:Transcript_14879/g.28404  ORF Transcript_14879/g.28404 Transcript_14879/m.28404 type:complete len:347 (-) Transcript_14879:189-1229(-)|eukprot:scaffold8681_cov200-Amphora_coffeaeformis.AAC.3